MKSLEQIAASQKTLAARRNANLSRASYNAAKENGYYTCAVLRELLANADADAALADALEREEAAGMFIAA